MKLVILMPSEDTMWPLDLSKFTLMGRTLLEHQLALLRGARVSEIIVVGKRQPLRSPFDVRFVESMERARDFLDEEFVIIEPLVRVRPSLLAEVTRKRAEVICGESTKVARSCVPRIRPARPLKYPWQLLDVASSLLRHLSPFIHPDARVSNAAVIEGPVYIDRDVIVSRGAKIVGPAYIGCGAFVGDGALVRRSVIEDECVVGAYMEVARSILERGVTTHSGYIGDSILSEGTHTGAGFITANVRLDEGEIHVFVPVERRRVATGRRKLGVITGERANFGIHSGTMPGVLVGKRAVIGPGTLVFRNVPDGVRIFSFYSAVPRV